MNFFVSPDFNSVRSYEELINDINNKTSAKKFINTKDPYLMLVELLTCIEYGKEAILLDSDFSDVELKNLGFSSDELNFEYKLEDTNKIQSTDDFFIRIKNSCWHIWLLTSGTTGLPKKVKFSYENLLRNVRQNDKHSGDIWAMAYRLSHMAGVQVFFQALLNMNPILYVFESNPKDIPNYLSIYGCTHISATPTFYRQILPYMRSVNLNNIKHMTFGGERYDSGLANELLKILPHVKLHNIYALTEGGSLFSSNSDVFSVPECFRDKVKISEDKELLIHSSILGRFNVDGEWYNTHDLVEMNEDGTFKFISRKSDLINIGGYKVNPLEVEAELLKVPGIKDCVVKSRSNSVMGNILTADLIVDEDIDKKVLKKEIQEHLQKSLQPFKIPRLINFTDKINKTTSGKKIRK